MLSSRHTVAPAASFNCHWCGQSHAPIPLAPGERALCTRCGKRLVQRSRFGRDAALAYAVTGAILAVPALTLPLVTVGRLRMERAGFLDTGVEALWDDGMRILAIWVWLCGILTPILLLVTLACLLFTPQVVPRTASTTFWWRAARALEHWSMPEVFVLAILVALTKLGSLVNVQVGLGLWCYAGMAFMTLLAWQSLDFTPSPIRREGAVRHLP